MALFAGINGSAARGYRSPAALNVLRPALLQMKAIW